MTADLEDLLQRVKAATGPDRQIDADLCLTLGGDHSGHLWRRPGEVGWYGAPAEVTASTDAALALVERLMPGACWTVENPRPDRIAAVAFVGLFDESVYIGKGVTPPLAILAALLQALIAQPKGTDQ